MKTPDINLRVLVSGQDGSSERKLQRKVVEEGPGEGSHANMIFVATSLTLSAEKISCGDILWSNFDSHGKFYTT